MRSIFSIIICLFAGNITAQTYNTIAGNTGLFRTCSNWSNCPDGANITNGTINIYHSIFREYNLFYRGGNNTTNLNGGSLTIGSIANPKNLRIFQNANSSINVGSGDTLYVTNDVLMDDNGWGTNITIANGGVMIIGGDLNEVNYNNFEIDGVLVVCGNLAVGNINNSSGKIYVSGTATGSFNGIIANFNNLAADYPIINAMIPCAILPIKLTSFNATYTSRLVNFMWQTASEINNDYFTIERSADGLNWEWVNDINGAGNSSELLDYNAIDENPYPRMSYYRLKQTDFDGQFEYSNTIAVAMKNDSDEEVLVFPNPTFNKITVVGESGELEGLKVYNILEQNIISAINIISKQENILEIDLSNIEPGVFILKTKTKSQKIFKK